MFGQKLDKLEQSVAQKREVLEGNEMVRFLDSLEREKDSIPAQCIKFVLSQEFTTGIGCLSNLKWSGIDFEKKEISIDYQFNGKTQTIRSPMYPAESLLREMRDKRDKTNPFVFPVPPPRKNLGKRSKRKGGRNDQCCFPADGIAALFYVHQKWQCTRTT